MNLRAIARSVGILVAAVGTTPSWAAEPGWQEYGCAEAEEIGFKWDGQAMARVTYPGTTFLFALHSADMAAILQNVDNTRTYLDCFVAYRLAPDTVSCHQGAHLFVLDTKSGRFNYTRQFGFAFPDPRTGGPNADPLAVGFGYCVAKQ